MSHKVYVTGSRPDIRVPMREVALSGGNPSLRLYDTSGPATDPEALLDVKRGLPPLRQAWILGRTDVEELPGPTSVYRRQRDDDPALGGIRFATTRRPLRGRAGRSARIPGGASPRCTTPGAARSRPRWSSSPSARAWRRSWSATKWRAGARSSRRT